LDRAGTAILLQALLEGPTVRELVHRGNSQVQAATGMRVLIPRSNLRQLLYWYRRGFGVGERMCVLPIAGEQSPMIKTLRMATLGGVAAFALLANPVVAEQLTAGGLYEFCNSNDGFVQNACRYFILGVVEGVSAADGTVLREEHIVPGRKTIICIPEDVTVTQMVVAFQNAMRLLSQAYPDDLKLPAVLIVLSTMSHQYPCH
jgi:hypothetical protein